MKYGFGVDVGGTTVKLGLLSEAGELLEKWELPTRTENGGENILHYNHTEVISSHFKDNLAEVRTYLRKWIEAQPAATDK